MKPARLRPAAETDLLSLARWYGERGGRVLAETFFDEAREALMTVESMPTIGSPRLGLQSEQAGLRSWPLEHFPVRWFYFEWEDYLDVVRLLGERQDIAAILAAGLD